MSIAKDLRMHACTWYEGAAVESVLQLSLHTYREAQKDKVADKYSSVSPECSS